MQLDCSFLVRSFFNRVIHLPFRSVLGVLSLRRVPSMSVNKLFM